MSQITVEFDNTKEKDLYIKVICTDKSTPSKTETRIKKIDLEYIVVETDSPYLSPEPYRGKRNEPINVKIIMKKICDIKGLKCSEVEDTIRTNVLGLFDNKLDL